LRRAEGGANIFGVFRVKNHDFTPKNHIFFNLRGAPGAPLPGSAPANYRDRSHGAVTNMIDTLQWDSLACKRTKARLILLYEINGGLVEVPTTMLSQYVCK
jgi:hypothetical protein